MTKRATTSVGPQGRAPRRRSATLPLLGAASMAAGLQTATQVFAGAFDYQPALGAHFHHIYAPWAILGWAAQWYSQYPDVVTRAASIGAVVGGVGLLGVAIAKAIAANTSTANEHLHGSARWATKADIEHAGLLPRPRRLRDVLHGAGAVAAEGVYVGAWKDASGQTQYLRHNGPEHILNYAPTRSGKGVGLVVPTLLSWPASCVITDLKGELWALTAGWRREHAHNSVLRFEPATLTGCVRWNPLDEIRINTEYEVGDAQNLATLLVDPDGKGLESHWQKTAFSLLVGVILHVLYKAHDDGVPASLPGVDAILSDPSRDVASLWVEMASYGHLSGRNHPLVGSAARDMMDRPEEEAGSVLSTAKSYLSLYRDPVVAHNVSASEFRIRDLMNHDNPVSLYIVTQPADKARLRPLVRVLVNMVIRVLAEKMDFEGGRAVARYKHRLLMMLDEFPALGKLDILQESLAFLAGYGIKCYLICQDINQLRSREMGYGHDEAITSNCHIQNAFPPNRIETADHLSKLTGTATVVNERITVSGKRVGMLGQVSKTFQEFQRPLLTPDECLRMPGPRKDAVGDIEQPGDMLIFVAGYPAIYGTQPLYFKDPIFRARAAVAAPATSDTLHPGLAEGDGVHL